MVINRFTGPDKIHTLTKKDFGPLGQAKPYLIFFFRLNWSGYSEEKTARYNLRDLRSLPVHYEPSCGLLQSPSEPHLRRHQGKTFSMSKIFLRRDEVDLHDPCIA